MNLTTLRSLFATLTLSLLLTGPAIAAQTTAVLVDRPRPGENNPHYVGMRPPLEQTRLVKLPVGTIRPEGWLRKQIELQLSGFMGHLDQISRFLADENNAWLDPEGGGTLGWEEVPYWLKGYLNAAYVLDDEDAIAKSNGWIEAALASQDDDGE